MNNRIITITPIIAAATLLLSAGAQAQDKKPGDSQVGTPSSSTGQPKPALDELEAKFKATMTKATMAGHWTSTKNGALSPEKEDKYTIVGVTKLSGDAWIVSARIQYNKRDIVAPIPVQVKWAGDTPVIVVDKIPMPGGGVYSARVLVYEHTYAGTWSGGDHGGLLYGLITNESDAKPVEGK